MPTSVSAMPMFRHLLGSRTEMQVDSCGEHQDIEHCQNDKESNNLPLLCPLACLRTLNNIGPTATEHEP